MDSAFGLITAAMMGALALDLAFCAATGRRHYRFDRTVPSIAGFLSAKVFLFLFARLTFDPGRIPRGWNWIHADPSSWKDWALCLLIADFLYYVSHYAYHRVNALWALHILHHQSEEYNLATGLTTGWLTEIVGTVFYLPVILAGFPWRMVLISTTVVGLYQFLLHQEHVGKLGRLESILVTPSQHRVHHGTEPRYIDRNFGGVLVLWDRLFGTFQEEKAKPTFGITLPLETRTFAWLNLHYWVELGRRARGFPRWRDRIALWLMPPDWRPAGVETETPARPLARAPIAPPAPLPPGLAAYIAFQLALGSVALVALLQPHSRELPLPLALAACLSLWLLLFDAAEACERPRAGLRLELARHGASAVAGALLLRHAPPGSVVTTLVCAWLASGAVFGAWILARPALRAAALRG